MVVIFVYNVYELSPPPKFWNVLRFDNILNFYFGFLQERTQSRSRLLCANFACRVLAILLTAVSKRIGVLRASYYKSEWEFKLIERL